MTTRVSERAPQLLLIAILFLSGCGTPMTNDQIILETKRCRDAGLNVKVLRLDLGDGPIARVECVP